VGQDSPCDIGGWVCGVCRELDVTAPVQTVEDFIAGLGWGTSGEGGVAVDPVPRDASAGDVGGAGENEDGTGDEMRDRVDPDAFDAWTGCDGVVGRDTNEWAGPVASQETPI
jgi:hypothetical protein